MAIVVTCDACGAKLRVRDEYLGKEASCPSCKAALTLAGERVPDHEVFISYSNKDKTVADAICATLEKRKMRCWIAPRDIAAGDSWGGSIIEAIGDAKVMVLVYSGNSNLSQQVIREVERAVAKGLALVPFRIDAAPMSREMEYFLSSSHWLDAMTGPLERHLERLAETCRGHLRGKPAATAGGSRGWLGSRSAARRATFLWLRVLLLLLVLLCGAYFAWPYLGKPATTTQPHSGQRETVAAREPARMDHAPSVIVGPVPVPAAKPPDALTTNDPQLKQPGTQTLQLAWARNPKVEKRYPSSDQILNASADLLGEVTLVGSNRRPGPAYPAPVATVRYSGRESGQNTDICEFRFDDPVGQTRTGKAEGILFTCRVTEITRGTVSMAHDPTIETLTIAVTAKRQDLLQPDRAPATSAASTRAANADPRAMPAVSTKPTTAAAGGEGTLRLYKGMIYDSQWSVGPCLSKTGQTCSVGGLKSGFLPQGGYVCFSYNNVDADNPLTMTLYNADGAVNRVMYKKGKFVAMGDGKYMFVDDTDWHGYFITDTPVKDGSRVTWTHTGRATEEHYARILGSRRGGSK
ncbi:MAG: hypothetical protein BWX88_01524 [Planctomycetes bacterium ADurb.Bin126]|nr:MAG: hypothetical protein BWX88_01524 [Planctomycetes bacterium ADurb.Bin126]HOD84309.1 toll/interleukin-1 receptor domain-containing protein [Phycisphaerae bacterium]HQL73583.1 toll/interleukin-1 receptor domain-containing protein [Phycisphaerae bacterium]